MPIDLPKPPRNVARAAERRAAEWAGRGGFARLVWAPRESLGARRETSLAAPHQIYTANLDVLVDPGSVEKAAAPTAWSFLIEERDRPVAATEVNISMPAETPAQLAEGPFVEAVAEELQTIESLLPLREAHFELRQLRVPALQLAALWLHSGERDDVFVPLKPAPPPLEAHVPYPEARFVAVVSKLARSMIDAHQSGDEPDRLGS